MSTRTGRSRSRGSGGAWIAAGLLASATLVGAPSDVAAAEPGDAERGNTEPTVIAVEAEHFVRQRRDQRRRWWVATAAQAPRIEPDGDPPHHEGASGGAYLEVLPDTRRTHADPLVPGESFANEPGVVAILDYEVRFPRPGRYYVWVRAYSTGSEDNGLHVGLDGEWPATGARMQWCAGKHSWWWESKQRTAANHCGEPHKIYLDVPRRGRHTVSFSMREDGFEFDKFLLTTDRGFKRPEGEGPQAARPPRRRAAQDP